MAETCGLLLLGFLVGQWSTIAIMSIFIVGGRSDEKRPETRD